ncbi:MAG TPA: hypothetical protein DCO79_13380 [Spirochaeta sp.]|nr:hypothetical protein [Spirochaeta sp.]
MIELKIFGTSVEIADYSFDILKTAETAALSFGSTYEGIFRRWRELCGGVKKTQLPALFPADERLVDIADDGSNWGAARKSFIEHCGNASDSGRWARDADVYHRMLRDQFGEGTPVFDLIFLGIGPDGHTASLFPDDCPTQSDPAWNETVLETTAPFVPPKRLTLGPDVIASTRHLLVTVTGSGKAEIFKKLMNELNAPEAYATANLPLLPPARIITRREELKLNTEVLCDNAAAEKLANDILQKYRVDI